MKPVTFVGLTDYHKPYTRVRCYNFADKLRQGGQAAGVFSFQEQLTDYTDGVSMLENSVGERLRLTWRAFRALPKGRNNLFVIQKVHYHTAAPYLIHRLTGTPYILDYDDWDLDRSPLFTPLLNRVFFGAPDTAGVTAEVARRSQCCLAASRGLEQYLRQHNANVHYLPTGVDTDTFSFRKRTLPEKPVFVWTGMVWGKVIYDNLVWVIDALAEVRQERRLELRVVGDGCWLPRLRDYITERQAGDWVRVYDFIAPDEIPAFLAQCHIGLVPLIPDRDNYDWMRCKSPTKLFEFMAAGIPALCSDFGELREIVRNGENGFLFCDREQLIRQVAGLTGNAQRYNAIAQTARNDIETHYSLTAIIPRLQNIIEQQEGFKPTENQ